MVEGREDMARTAKAAVRVVNWRVVKAETENMMIAATVVQCRIVVL